MHWRKIEKQDRIDVATRAFMCERGHEDAPAFSVYVEIDDETVGIAVASLRRVAEMIGMLEPLHIELVCAQLEGSAQLRRDLEFLIRGGSVH